MEKNNHILKQLTSAKPAQKKAGPTFASVPGVEYVKSTFKNTTKKNVFDVALFTAGLVLMYKFGKEMSSKIDEWIPTEQ